MSLNNKLKEFTMDETWYLFEFVNFHRNEGKNNNFCSLQEFDKFVNK